MAAKKTVSGEPRAASSEKRKAIETPADIEGLGVFYLGQKLASQVEGAPAGGQPLLIDARRFTTHAVCVGMTGSG
ncbi:MAG: hypothetical protein ACKOHK_01670, partial [Planctomycetia bacterium]